MSAGAAADGEVFIKTSTGKVTPAATMPVTLVMLEAIRDLDVSGLTPLEALNLLQEFKSRLEE